MKHILTIIAALALISCDKITATPVIDGSSADAYEASLDAMAGSLSEQKARAFEEAVIVIAIEALVVDDAAATKEAMMEQLEGLNAEEIIALGKDL